MIARVAGQRVLILSLLFVALGLVAVLRPPEVVEDATRMAGWFVLALALVGVAFGVYLWVRGGDRVI